MYPLSYVFISYFSIPTPHPPLRVPSWWVFCSSDGHLQGPRDDRREPHLLSKSCGWSKESRWDVITSMMQQVMSLGDPNYQTTLFSTVCVYTRLSGGWLFLCNNTLSCFFCRKTVSLPLREAPGQGYRQSVLWGSQYQATLRDHTIRTPAEEWVCVNEIYCISSKNLAWK